MLARATKNRLSGMAAVTLCALVSACSLLLDRDALSSEYSKPGAGAGGAGSVVTDCVPAADDIYCDGMDQDCAPTASDAACPTGCAPTNVDGELYMACSISGSFDAAESRCQAQQMHLIRIDGGTENELAMELARSIGSYVWIGGSNRSDEARFEWTDGTAFYENGAPVAGVYQNFGPDQPAPDAARRCVALHDSSGFWSTAPCSDSLQFICGR